MLELLCILEILDHEEGQTEQHRQNQPDDRLLPKARLRPSNRKRHRQAAPNEHDGVDSAEREVQLVAAFGPRFRVPHAVEHVGEEQASEEQHLGDQKQPHPERGCLMLLIQRVEVVL